MLKQERMAVRAWCRRPCDAWRSAGEKDPGGFDGARMNRASRLVRAGTLASMHG